TVKLRSDQTAYAQKKKSAGRGELMGLFDFFRKKKPVDDVDAESGGNPATCHCFVLCTEAELGDLSRAAEIVSEVFGADYSAEISKGNIVSVTHGESTVGFL